MQTFEHINFVPSDYNEAFRLETKLKYRDGKIRKDGILFL